MCYIVGGPCPSVDPFKMWGRGTGDVTVRTVRIRKEAQGKRIQSTPRSEFVKDSNQYWQSRDVNGRAYVRIYLLEVWGCRKSTGGDIMGKLIVGWLSIRKGAWVFVKEQTRGTVE